MAACCVHRELKGKTDCYKRATSFLRQQRAEKPRSPPKELARTGPCSTGNLSSLPQSPTHLPLILVPSHDNNTTPRLTLQGASD